MFSLDYSSSANVFAKVTNEFSGRFKVTVSLLLSQNCICEKKEKSSDEKTVIAVDSVLDSSDCLTRTERHRAFYRRWRTREITLWLPYMIAFTNARVAHTAASASYCSCICPLLFRCVRLYSEHRCTSGATVRYYSQDIVIYIHVSAEHVSFMHV